MPLWSGDDQGPTLPRMEPTSAEDRPSRGVPPPSAAQPAPKHQSEALGNWGEALIFLAVLVALGAIIAAIFLATHSVKDCGPNPYDPNFDYCNGNKYPLVGLAFAVGVGGLLQAALLGVVGRTAIEVQLISRTVRKFD